MTYIIIAIIGWTDSRRLFTPKITNIFVRTMNKGNMQSLSPMAHNLFQLLKQNMCLHLIMYVGITITYPEEIWCLLSTVTFSDSIAESSLLSSSIWVADCFVASSASAKESSWRNSSSTSWNKVEFEIAVAAAWLRNVFSQDYFFNISPSILILCPIESSKWLHVTIALHNHKPWNKKYNSLGMPLKTKINGKWKR